MGKIEKFGEQDPMLKWLDSCSILIDAEPDEEAINKYKTAVNYLLDLQDKGFCTIEQDFDEVTYNLHAIYIHWKKEYYENIIEISTREMSELFNNMNGLFTIDQNGDWSITSTLYIGGHEEMDEESRQIAEAAFSQIFE